jgi:hypothetical protein
MLNCYFHHIVVSYGYGNNNAALFRQFNSALENPFGNQLGLMTPELPIDTGVADLALNVAADFFQNAGEFSRQLIPLIAGDSCKSPTTNKEMGICTASPACTAGGGRVSGACSATLVCCISKFFSIVISLAVY